MLSFIIPKLALRKFAMVVEKLNKPVMRMPEHLFLDNLPKFIVKGLMQIKFE
jgi:hypothetical protein